MVPLNKKYLRNAKKTILIVGEGPTEKAFLLHIKELYISREDNLSVKVECGAGGSPASVAHRANRLKQSADYDKCFLIIDADTCTQEAKNMLKRRPAMEIILVTPCIEGLFLAILKGNAFSQTGISSAECKRRFENNHLDRDKKTEKCKYSGLFTKTMLDEARSRLLELDMILKAFNK